MMMATTKKLSTVDKESSRAFVELLSDQLENLAIEVNSIIRQFSDDSRNYDEAITLELSREDLRLMVDCLNTDSADPYVKSVAARFREQLQQGFALDALQAVNTLETVVSNHVDSLVIARFFWNVFSQARSALSTEAESALQVYMSRQGIVDVLVQERTAQLVVFRSLVENTTDAIVMSDFNRRISFANPAA